MDRHIRQVERYMGVEINNRGNSFHVSGSQKSVQLTQQLLIQMYATTESEPLSSEGVHLHLQSMQMEDELAEDLADEVSIKTKRGMIRGRTTNQKRLPVKHSRK